MFLGMICEVYNAEWEQRADISSKSKEKKKKNVPCAHNAGLIGALSAVSSVT